LDSTGGEVWNFKLDVDGTLALGRLARTTHASPKPSRHATTSFIVTLNRRKAKFGAHYELLTTTKLFNLPNDSRLFWRIMDGSDTGSKAW
jgi:hypothetical protein